jgi:hypothetical protein
MLDKWLSKSKKTDNTNELVFFPNIPGIEVSCTYLNGELVYIRDNTNSVNINHNRVDIVKEIKNEPATIIHGNLIFITPKKNNIKLLQEARLSFHEVDENIVDVVFIPNVLHPNNYSKEILTVVELFDKYASYGFFENNVELFRPAGVSSSHDITNTGGICTALDDEQLVTFECDGVYIVENNYSVGKQYAKKPTVFNNNFYKTALTSVTDLTLTPIKDTGKYEVNINVTNLLFKQKLIKKITKPQQQVFKIIKIGDIIDYDGVNVNVFKTHKNSKDFQPTACVCGEEFKNKNGELVCDNQVCVDKVKYRLNRFFKISKLTVVKPGLVERAIHHGLFNEPDSFFKYREKPKIEILNSLDVEVDTMLEQLSNIVDGLIRNPTSDNKVLLKTLDVTEKKFIKAHKHIEDVTGDSLLGIFLSFMSSQTPGS